MAHGEGEVTVSSQRSNDFINNLQRTISDISFELTMAAEERDDEVAAAAAAKVNVLPPIHEVEDARCECCGMNEECTPEYIRRVRDKFSGKWICGLCSEAVEEEREKNGEGKSEEEALTTHMSHCVRFNKLGRAYPVLCQAEAMREILRRRSSSRGARSKSMSPKEKGGAAGKKKGGIARSSSCMPALTREMNGLALDKTN
ncbi:hypothetical protein Dimus_027697 [Dionaea muscipula]